MVTDGNYTYHGKHFVLYIIWYHCVVPETNITAYINYISIKNIEIKKLNFPQRCVMGFKYFLLLKICLIHQTHWIQGEKKSGENRTPPVLLINTSY